MKISQREADKGVDVSPEAVETKARYMDEVLDDREAADMLRALSLRVSELEGELERVNRLGKIGSVDSWLQLSERRVMASIENYLLSRCISACCSGSPNIAESALLRQVRKALAQPIAAYEVGTQEESE